MPLSWNEIKSRAVAFSREWARESSEDAEAKSFWDCFFDVFGISRRRVASFETPVKKSGGHDGYIDLLWKGVLVVEHKSRGKDLDRAFRQALDYFPGLAERDLPRYVLVSDFARFRLHDLEEGTAHEFPLSDLHKNVRRFGFVAGYQTRSFGQEDPVNVKAAEKLGKLHDLLKGSGYDGHPLELFLVRILFCLFAEDTSIFWPRQFADWLAVRTAEDGSDAGNQLAMLFETLNTPVERRQAALDASLAEFPYVNGRLFEERLPMAAFDRKMRETLLDCAALDWSRISPAIFGSLFQSIMDPKARRNLGAHYTTETNILKCLNPLFLDGLHAELEKVRHDPKRLAIFQKKLAAIRILDPACGCGNFLVVAYRELRLLELEVIRELWARRGQGELDVTQLAQVDVDRFHGIEIEEFPAQIAQVALWLMDHQMNMRLSEEFGQYYVRLPLKKSPHVVNGNALALDWREVIAPDQLSYIVGNPPFVGKKEQSPAQKAEVLAIFRSVKGAGVLDYVTCWYRKATEYMKGNPSVRAAFVSTNSITQGEQVGVLWKDLLSRGVKIHFAHRTFQWSSEARGKAAVHCVIVGFALEDTPEKVIFDYETPKSEPHAIRAGNINPYLVDAPDLFMERRTKPVGADTPAMAYGSMPIDEGCLILTDEEQNALVAGEPVAEPWIRRYLGAEEFINGSVRHCLWLVGCPPETLRAMSRVRERIAKCREFRQGSDRPQTRALAATPQLFGEIRQPADEFLVVPKVSSENRPYMPIGFVPPDVIASGSTLVVPHAHLFHLGVLSSTMHMAWMRAVCGRMKSDYQYSAGIVYNNFPWPEPTESQRAAIEAAAQGVLDARAAHPGATLADLYDPLAMPPDLVKAHAALDRAVDAAYGKKAFASEADRVAFLFEHYRELVGALPAPAPKKPARRRVPNA